jgi:hypothetical protein
MVAENSDDEPDGSKTGILLVDSAPNIVSWTMSKPHKLVFDNKLPTEDLVHNGFIVREEYFGLDGTSDASQSEKEQCVVNVASDPKPSWDSQG